MTMAHIRVLQIVKGKGKAETLNLLPESYSSHRAFLESKPKEGEYLFLEAHLITGKKEDDGQPAQ